MKRARERLLFLLIITLIPSLIGCGPIITFNKYAPPDRPKSELATLQIDTTDLWIQQVGMFEVEIDLLEVKIDKKLAVRKKLKRTKVYLLTIFMSSQAPIPSLSGHHSLFV